MSLSRLEPTVRVADQVFDALQDAIMTGALSAGSRLRIRGLAEELGTSVMPVREAIARLETIGLVESVPYRGAVVKEFTSVELVQSYEVRRLLEMQATRLGATRMHADDVEALRTLHAAMSDAVDRADVTGYLDVEETFLSTIYAASGNAVLTEIIGVMWRRCRSYKMLGVRRELSAGQGEDLLSSQRRLIDACATADGDLAAQLTAESLDAAIARIEAAIAES